MNFSELSKFLAQFDARRRNSPVEWRSFEQTLGVSLHPQHKLFLDNFHGFTIQNTLNILDPFAEDGEFNLLSEIPRIDIHYSTARSENPGIFRRPDRPLDLSFVPWAADSGRNCMAFEVRGGAATDRLFSIEPEVVKEDEYLGSNLFQLIYELLTLELQSDGWDEGDPLFSPLDSRIFDAP